MAETARGGITRRSAVQGMAAAGVGLPVLAACSSETAPPAVDRISKADVPVGGGVVVQGAKVVITQPTKGDYKAFSAVCTHRGCVVSGVTETINCRCHGSRFSIEDGSVVGGPAEKPLGVVEVDLSGEEIRLP